MNLWQQLPRPIIALSPMDGVTDQPYRYIAKKYGRSDLIMTEFTSAEGVSRNATKLLRDFRFDESQRPVIAQIFGKEPEAFRTTALILGYLGLDGIDINMGCPAKSVQQSGSGAALIQTPKLAAQIIAQTKAGVQDYLDGKQLSSVPGLKNKIIKPIMERHEALPEKYKQPRDIPVSVKTRVGYDQPVTEEWISWLLKQEPAAISLHGRTLKQAYSGLANWNEITIASKLANEAGVPLLGNGDVTDVTSAQEKIAISGVDGVLVGRATFGNPWLLDQLVAWRNGEDIPTEPTLEQRIKVAVEHCEVYEATYPEEYFLPMRKHLAWYIKGFPNASEYRVKLMQTESAAEVKSILEPLLD